MKKFDVYEALKAEGYEAVKDQWGADVLVKEYVRVSDVAWYGKMESYLTVKVWFNSDHGTLQANYYEGHHYRPFKTKVHLNEKRAFNAIHDTIKNKGFAQ